MIELPFVTELWPRYCSRTSYSYFKD